MRVILLLAFIIGAVWLFFKLQQPTAEETQLTPTLETEQQEPEQQELEPIQADIVANQIQSNRNIHIYNRLSGDLKRVQNIQTELEKIERLLTTLESYGYFLSNGQLEKKLNLSISSYGGEQLEFSFDIINDSTSREMLFDTLLKRREALRSSLVDELTRISSYAVSKTESETIRNYDYNALRGVVKNVLKEVRGA